MISWATSWILEDIYEWSRRSVSMIPSWLSMDRLSIAKTLLWLRRLPPWKNCRDPHDNMFLECVVSATADCLVSGDDDLLVLRNICGIPIFFRFEISFNIFQNNKMFCKNTAKTKTITISPENKKQNLWEKIFSHLHATVGLGVLNVDNG